MLLIFKIVSTFVILFCFQMFSNCHQQIKSIRRITSTCTGPESIITGNLVNYFANRLQETSEIFGKSQNSYLNSKYYKPGFFLADCE